METIIAHGMVPILNENDAVSGNKGYTAENVFSDNDALASLVAGQVRARPFFVILRPVHPKSALFCRVFFCHRAIEAVNWSMSNTDFNNLFVDAKRRLR